MEFDSFLDSLLSANTEIRSRSEAEWHQQVRSDISVSFYLFSRRLIKVFLDESWYTRQFRVILWENVNCA